VNDLSILLVITLENSSETTLEGGRKKVKSIRFPLL
jgi:hypothetical protein